MKKTIVLLAAFLCFTTFTYAAENKNTYKNHEFNVVVNVLKGWNFVEQKTPSTLFVLKKQIDTEDAQIMLLAAHQSALGAASELKNFTEEQKNLYLKERITGIIKANPTAVITATKYSKIGDKEYLCSVYSVTDNNVRTLVFEAVTIKDATVYHFYYVASEKIFEKAVNEYIEMIRNFKNIY